MATKRTKIAKVEAPAARQRVKVEAPGNLNYFANSSERTSLEFISSGCVLQDQVLGGGYVLGRMSNIIGDKSTGKTLLAIEAIVNFSRQYKDGFIRYAEAEAAFDKPYAQALGMPLERVDWAELLTKDGSNDRTVEWLFEDLSDTLHKLKDQPAIYVVDSLDALSDREELKRDIDKGSFGANKAKKLGEMFRRLVGDMEKSRLLLLIISQIRDKIGVTFGETKMRTGGHSMDFYATHCLWLSQIAQMKRTVNKIERVVGLEIKAKCKKNKVGLPMRDCTYPLLFGYGIDDVTAGIEFLIDAGKSERLADVDMSVAGYKVRVANLRNKGASEMRAIREKLNQIVVQEWAAIEETFLPHAGKY